MIKHSLHKNTMQGIYGPFSVYYNKQIDEIVQNNAAISGKPNNTIFSYKGKIYKAKLSSRTANTILLHSSLHDRMDSLLLTVSQVNFEMSEVSTILRSIFNSSDDIAHILYLLPEHLHKFLPNNPVIRRNPRELDKDTEAEDYIYLKEKTTNRILLNSLLD